jgi:hypothetical protein
MQSQTAAHTAAHSLHACQRCAATAAPLCSRAVLSDDWTPDWENWWEPDWEPVSDSCAISLSMDPPDAPRTVRAVHASPGGNASDAGLSPRGVSQSTDLGCWCDAAWKPQCGCGTFSCTCSARICSYACDRDGCSKRGCCGVGRPEWPLPLGVRMAAPVATQQSCHAR